MSKEVSKYMLEQALKGLCELLGTTGRSNEFPQVFIVFDEAHLLTTPFHPKTTNNNFAELRWALGTLPMNTLFTIFLSMTGKYSQFMPPCGQDPSNCMNDGILTIPTPFIWLGFDQLMGKHKIFGKNKTLDDVTSLNCIAHMGRPL